MLVTQGCRYAGPPILSLMCLVPEPVSRVVLVHSHSCRSQYTCTCRTGFLHALASYLRSLMKRYLTWCLKEIEYVLHFWFTFFFLAGPQHFWKFAERASRGWRCDLHRSQQWGCEGNAFLGTQHCPWFVCHENTYVTRELFSSEGMGCVGRGWCLLWGWWKVN